MLSLVQDTLATPVPVNAPLAVALLLCGLAALLFGGHSLVTGASSLARRVGISPLMIGLTVVAFGTSSPELALNMVAVTDSPELAWGNIVGSNMANVGLVLGLACLISPLMVRGAALHRDLPLVLGATALFTALVFLPSAAEQIAGLDRRDGIVLLAGFLIVLALWYRAGRRDMNDPLVTEGQRADTGRSTAASVSLLVGGLLLLLGGAWAAERGAVDIARHIGLSEAVIGLTIVAVATSLPEVATALIAVRKNENDIAVGTVLGSNLFNIVLIMGLSATVHDIPMPSGGGVALGAMCLFTLALVWLYRPKRMLGRGWGAMVLASWVAIMVWSVLNGSAAN
jgi:cation:H+ antiporter